MTPRSVSLFIRGPDGFNLWNKKNGKQSRDTAPLSTVISNVVSISQKSCMRYWNRLVRLLSKLSGVIDTEESDFARQFCGSELNEFGSGSGLNILLTRIRILNNKLFLTGDNILHKWIRNCDINSDSDPKICNSESNVSK